MAHDNLSDFLARKKPPLQGHEQLTASLWQLNALMTVAVMTEGFYRLPEKALHSYFLIAGGSH